jgi:hypothetical protein
MRILKLYKLSFTCLYSLTCVIIYLHNKRIENIKNRQSASQKGLSRSAAFGVQRSFEHSLRSFRASIALSVSMNLK